MSTMFIERINLKDLEDSLAGSTTVQALVGVCDLAVEKLVSFRDELADRAAGLDSRTLRDIDPQELREQAQAWILGGVGAVQSGVQNAPQHLNELPETAQELPTKAQALIAELLSVAFTTYGDLAGRGKARVDQVRRTTAVEAAGDLGTDDEPISRPVTKKPAKKAAAKKTAKKAAAKKTPAKKTPAIETPANETPANETPAPVDVPGELPYAAPEDGATGSENTPHSGPGAGPETDG